MRVGIYRVTLKIDGEAVIAEGRVSNGVFQGLGALSGVVGVLAVNRPRAADAPDAVDAPDHGQIDGMCWERIDLSRPGATRSTSSSNASPRVTIAPRREDADDAMERGSHASDASKRLR